MTKPDPQRLIFGLFLLLLIIAMELVLHDFHISGWPAFMFLTVRIGVAAANLEAAKFLQWVGVELVGGAIAIGGIIGILKLMSTLFVPKGTSAAWQPGSEM
jgi:hypothetical protein